MRVNYADLELEIDAIPVDGGFWVNLNSLIMEVWKNFTYFEHMRPWQTIMNVLNRFPQDGLPYAWPEVFYATDNPFHPGEGYSEFFSKFEIIDGYLVPINT